MPNLDHFQLPLVSRWFCLAFCYGAGIRLDHHPIVPGFVIVAVVIASTSGKETQKPS